VTRQRRTNEEWSTETRAALMAAARAAFEHGYDEASIESIAAAASLTKGAVYHHYQDKRALFRAVFESVEEEIVQSIERAALKQATPYDGLLRGCEAFLDAVLEERAARIVLVDGPRVLGWKVWREIDARTGGLSLRRGLKAAMEAGQIVRTDVDAMATLISGGLNECALLCAESGASQRRRAAAGKALRLLLAGLRLPVELQPELNGPRSD